MSGRKAAKDIRPGNMALSVGNPKLDIPNGWIWADLGEIATMATGHTPSRNYPEYWGGDIPWISVKDARPFHSKTIFSTNENTNDLGISKSAAVVLPKGTVCLSRTGSIGYSIILGKEMATSQGFINWICSFGLLPRYLQLLFVAENTFLHTISEGVAHTTIYFPEAKAFHIALPPLAEQLRIVSKIEELFSDLDKGIETLKVTKQQLKVYRQAVLKYAFEGKLTLKWRANQAEKSSPQLLSSQIEKSKQIYSNKQLTEWETSLRNWRISDDDVINKKPSRPAKIIEPDAPSVDHEILKWEIPQEWLWTQIGKLCFVTKLAGFEYTDFVKYDERGDLPVLKAENAGPNGFKKTKFSKVHSKEVKHLKRSFIDGGELLIVFVGAGTGNVAAVPNDQKYFLGPNIGMARPYCKINSKFLEYQLQSALGKRMLSASIKAVAQPSLSMGTIRQTPIVFTSYEEQKQIVQEIESRLSICDKIEESIEQTLQQAEALRQSILKKAFEGKLVPQDPNDEPASVLLDRIKADRVATQPEKKTKTKKVKA